MYWSGYGVLYLIICVFCKNSVHLADGLLHIINCLCHLSKLHHALFNFVDISISGFLQTTICINSLRHVIFCNSTCVQVIARVSSRNFSQGWKWVWHLRHTKVFVYMTMLHI